MLPDDIRENAIHALLAFEEESMSIESSSSGSTHNNNMEHHDPSRYHRRHQDNNDAFIIPRIRDDDDEGYIRKAPAIVLLHDTIQMIREARNSVKKDSNDNINIEETGCNNKVHNEHHEADLIEDVKKKSILQTKSFKTYKRFIHRKHNLVTNNETTHPATSKVISTNATSNQIPVLDMSESKRKNEKGTISRSKTLEVEDQVNFSDKEKHEEIGDRRIIHKSQWKCYICTKENTSDNLTCKVCGRQRGYHGLGKKFSMHDGPQVNKSVQEKESDVEDKERNRSVPINLDEAIKNVKKNDIYLKQQLDYEGDCRENLVSDISGLLSSLRNNMSNWN